jgi:hypothetical protein
VKENIVHYYKPISYDIVLIETVTTWNLKNVLILCDTILRLSRDNIFVVVISRYNLD